MVEKKLVVITGASSGFGEAIAKKLSTEGYPLLLLARRIERMKALKLPNTLCRKVDVTNLETFRSAIKEAETQYGKVDCLINNAGIMLLGRVVKQTPEDWNRMFDVNVKGLLNGIHLVLSDMLERNEGTIINISSVAGRKNFGAHTVYCGSKFAVHAISEGLRQETAGSNVRVSVIAPGASDTELIDSNKTTTAENFRKSLSTMGERQLLAEDIANAVSFIYNQAQEICIRELAIATTRQEG